MIHRKIGHFVLSASLLAISLGILLSAPCTSQIFAQNTGIEPGETALTNPKERSTTVTATMPDVVSPSPPILIAPPNNSTHRSSPKFSWMISTDNVGVTGYALTLNGTLLFEAIPTIGGTTSQFTLTYDPLTQLYELTPKQSLPDGTHTWKITAYDARNNRGDSTTWTFTLDTLAPSFLITEVDSQVAAISSQDIATIPTTPITLSRNEPFLSGRGEANSSVRLLVSWGDTTTELNFSINAAGRWQVQLPKIPRDTPILLSFLITDIVGNISILEGVTLVLPTETVPLPLFPSDPDDPTQPGIEIPILTEPRELLLDLGEQATQLLPQDLRELAPLPQPLARIVAHTTKTLEPVAALLFVSTAPIVALITLMAPFGSGISAKLLGHAMYALGYLPSRKRQGIIFESDTQEPVPLAQVTLIGETADGHLVHLSTLCGTDAMYPHFTPGFGRYRVLVDRKHFSFPSLEKRPAHLSVENYYQGEEFVIDEHHPEPGLLIPLERISPEGRVDLPHWQLFLARLSQYREAFGVFSWLVMAVITALFPSYINMLTLASFTFIVVLRSFVFTRRITGQTLTTAGEPVRNVIIKGVHLQTGVVENICQSKSKGKFALDRVDTALDLVVVDAGRKWVTEEARVWREELHLQNPKHILIALERAESPIV
jgi:hypothetical protein